MKTLAQVTLAVATLIGSVHALAKNENNLVCSNMAGDGGYKVAFTADGLNATVTENNIAGAKVVAQVSCPKTKPAPCCDQVTTTVCTESDSSSDTSYSVTLATGGFTGVAQVTLRRGRNPLAVIVCNSASAAK